MHFLRWLQGVLLYHEPLWHAVHATWSHPNLIKVHMTITKHVVCKAAAVSNIPLLLIWHVLMCVMYSCTTMNILVLSVYCFPSHCLLTPLMSPKDKKCKLIDWLMTFWGLGAWVCRGAARGDSHTRQCGAARPGLQNFPWRPPLLQVAPPLCPSVETPCCLSLTTAIVNGQSNRASSNWTSWMFFNKVVAARVAWNPVSQGCAAKDLGKLICQSLLCLTVPTSVTNVNLQITAVCVNC